MNLDVGIVIIQICFVTNKVNMLEGYEMKSLGHRDISASWWKHSA